MLIFARVTLHNHVNNKPHLEHHSWPTPILILSFLFVLQHTNHKKVCGTHTEGCLRHKYSGTHLGIHAPPQSSVLQTGIMSMFVRVFICRWGSKWFKSFRNIFGILYLFCMYAFDLPIFFKQMNCVRSNETIRHGNLIRDPLWLSLKALKGKYQQWEGGNSKPNAFTVTFRYIIHNINCK